MKRRFDFRLERVRRVRELEERVARSERIQAEGAARAAEARRDRARAALERSRAELAVLLGFTPGDSQADGSGARPLAANRILLSQRVLEHELGGLRRAVESARTLRIQSERIASLHQQRKGAVRVLEELRERARLRHAAEVQKADNASLDETAQLLDGAGRRRARRAKVENDSSADGAPTDHA